MGNEINNAALIRQMRCKERRMILSCGAILHGFQIQKWSMVVRLRPAEVSQRPMRHSGHKRSTYPVLHHGHFICAARGRKSVRDEYNRLCPGAGDRIFRNVGNGIKYVILGMCIERRSLTASNQPWFWRCDIGVLSYSQVHQTITDQRQAGARA